jgi:hypothetical protein
MLFYIFLYLSYELLSILYDKISYLKFQRIQNNYKKSKIMKHLYSHNLFLNIN